MIVLPLVIAVGLGMIALERAWPARTLPRVRAWWPRVVLLNGVQAGLVVLGGVVWDGPMRRASLLDLSEHAGPAGAGAIAYLASAVVFYFWHRLRHESTVFWRLCHQLHHSPRRLEIVMAFYKHPVESLLNALASSTVCYLLLGCSVAAASVCVALSALAELFYHWNVRTPRWLGFIIQRPEAHRVHHRRGHHASNYGDLPVLDLVFGTFEEPRGDEACGFSAAREDRLDDMLAFRDVNDAASRARPPLGFLPTCIGCRKRWACSAANAPPDVDVRS